MTLTKILNDNNFIVQFSLAQSFSFQQTLILPQKQNSKFKSSKGRCKKKRKKFEENSQQTRAELGQDQIKPGLDFSS